MIEDGGERAPGSLQPRSLGRARQIAQVECSHRGVGRLNENGCELVTAGAEVVQPASKLRCLGSECRVRISGPARPPEATGAV